MFVGIQVKDQSETADLVDKLQRSKLPTLDLTDNEMAKLHLRHLVGGHAPEAKDEILFRFEFPERPGALMNFLNSMNHSWNISLFHYRNHGADYGRVLVGMQVPRTDKKALKTFLDNARLPVLGRERQPGLPAVPGVIPGGHGILP